MYSLEHRQAISAYFEAFGRAVEVVLRPYRGQLHRRWLGIDRRPTTVLLAFDETRCAAVLTGRWLGAPVVTVDQPVSELVGGPFLNARDLGEKDLFSVALKRLAGEGKVSYALSTDYRLRIDLNSPGTSIAFVGPALYNGVSDDLAARAQPLQTDPEREAVGLVARRPPWVFCVLSNQDGPEVLTGLDPDPIIAAHGVADAMLALAGEIAGPPGARYAQAASKLRTAIKTLTATNERAIHNVILEYPWILVDECDYREFSTEPRWEYTEFHGNDRADQRLIIPDFVYELFDDVTLVVEIESYGKRLFITRTEGTFEVPSAASLAAVFQILGYQRVVDGPMSRDIRRSLNKADASSFRCRLVLGSELQPDFDSRSWAHVRDVMHSAGIELRTWDHYLGRLDRLEAAASYAMIA